VTVQFAGGVTAVHERFVVVAVVAEAERPVGTDGAAAHEAALVVTLRPALCADVPNESAAATVNV
jgi:hypothetical protein